jgi:HEAT repeat protein
MYVPSEILSFIETRRKMSDEMIMRGFPMGLMIKDQILIEAISKVEESDEKIRAKAVQELPVLKTPKAVPQLISAMIANFPSVRLNVAIALG